MRTRSFALAAVLMLLMTNLASADPIVQYSYTGPGLIYERTGAYLSTEPQLTMTLDFASVIPQAPQDTWNTDDPLSWTVSDGINSFSSAICQTASCSDSFAFSADANGDITSWNISIHIQNPTPGISLFAVGSSFACGLNDLCGGDQTDAAETQYTDSSPLSFAEGDHNTILSDSLWSTPILVSQSAQNVPEPTSFILVLSGLAGFVGFYRFPQAFRSAQHHSASKAKPRAIAV